MNRKGVFLDAALPDGAGCDRLRQAQAALYALHARRFAFVLLGCISWRQSGSAAGLKATEKGKGADEA